MSNVILTAQYAEFKVHLELGSKVSDKLKVHLQAAIDHMAKKIGSRKFYDFCYGHTYNVTKYTGKLWWKKSYLVKNHGFSYNQGYQGESIHNILIHGEEVLNGIENKQADIFLKIDPRWWRRKAIGYTYPSTKWQWVRSWFLGYDYKEIAGHLAHEWCHKMGFTHPFNNTQDRKYSVNYAVGYYVSEA